MRLLLGVIPSDNICQVKTRTTDCSEPGVSLRILSDQQPLQTLPSASMGRSKRANGQGFILHCSTCNEQDGSDKMETLNCYLCSKHLSLRFLLGWTWTLLRWLDLINTMDVRANSTHIEHSLKFHSGFHLHFTQMGTFQIQYLIWNFQTTATPDARHTL